MPVPNPPAPLDTKWPQFVSSMLVPIPPLVPIPRREAPPPPTEDTKCADFVSPMLVPHPEPPPRREAPPKDAGDGWAMVAFPAALWNRREAPGAIIRREAPRRPKARSPARGAATQISSGWAASAGSPRRVSLGAGSLPKFSSSTGPNEFIPYGENGVDRPLPTLASCVCFSRTRAYHGIGPRVLFWRLEKAEVAVDILTNLTRRKWLSVDFRRFLVRNLFRSVKSPTPRSQFNPSAGRAMAVRATPRPGAPKFKTFATIFWKCDF